MSGDTRLVFLLGVAPRSGTNFAADLLAIHNDCDVVRTPPEDGIVRSAHHLVEFDRDLQQFYERWGPGRGPGALAAVGRGLSTWLAGGTEAPVVVSKTPFTDNIGLVTRIFPEAHVVVIAHDGRDVAESTRRSWGSPLDVAIDRWRQGVRNVREVFDREDTSGWLTIVKYEDLLNDRAATIRRLLGALALDPVGYDFDAADNLAIRGSSTHQGDGARLSWEPVDPKGFSGANRAAEWTDSENALFAAMAKSESQWLGYDVPPMEWNAAAATSYSKLLGLRRTMWDSMPPGLKQRLRSR